MSEKNEKILGIDLGTSNSAACVFVNDKATMIPSAEGHSMYGKAFPSYVAFTEDGTQLVGQPAKNQAVENPENTISQIKRQMGKDYKVPIQGKEYTPQEISAMILQKIKRDAESFLGEPVSKAVITVPANFDNNQRTATKDAGRIAGLEVLRLINEPTAASLAYGIDKQQEDDVNVLIFDLGGGTLDITIMEFGNGIFDVQSTNGDTHLGGTDMDNVLIKYLADEFKKKHGIDLTKDNEASRRLREGAEQAKIELSNLPKTTVKLPFIAMGNEGTPLNLDETITRTKLEELVRPIVERCGQSIDQAVLDAEDIDSIDEINKVILVGGPTRMPIVQDYVEKYTGKKVERGVDPMECVSQGACILGAILGEDSSEKNNPEDSSEKNNPEDSSEINGPGIYKKPIILDVTSSSLGTVVFGGITSFMIKKQTHIPAEFTRTFTTVEDNQSKVKFEVVEGENEMANSNTKLGSFFLSGIQPAPKGIPQIEVTFKIDENGILNVTAHDKETGNENSIEIKDHIGMNEEEIRLAKARNKANSEIASAQELIDSQKDKNHTNPKILEILERVPSLISELKELKESKDVDSITQKTTELNDARVLLLFLLTQ